MEVETGSLCNIHQWHNSSLCNKNLPHVSILQYKQQKHFMLGRLIVGRADYIVFLLSIFVCFRNSLHYDKIPQNDIFQSILDLSNRSNSSRESTLIWGSFLYTIAI